KVTIFRWRWALPMAAALAWNISPAIAQQPFNAVDLIKPIEAAPLEAVPIEPQPAETSRQEDSSIELAAEEPTPAAAAAAETEAKPARGAPADDDQPREMIKERFGNGALRSER